MILLSSMWCVIAGAAWKGNRRGAARKTLLSSQVHGREVARGSKSFLQSLVLSWNSKANLLKLSELFSWGEEMSKSITIRPLERCTSSLQSSICELIMQGLLHSTIVNRQVTLHMTVYQNVSVTPKKAYLPAMSVVLYPSNDVRKDLQWIKFISCSRMIQNAASTRPLFFHGTFCIGLECFDVTRTSIRHPLIPHAGLGRSDLIRISIRNTWSISKTKGSQSLAFRPPTAPSENYFSGKLVPRNMGQHSHQNDETTATRPWHAVDERRSLDESNSGLVKLILGMKRVNQLKRL